MGRVNDTISNVNAAVRNLLMVVLVGGAGYGGYKAYDLYNEPKKQLAEKDRLLAEKDKSLEDAIKNLSDANAKNTELTAANTVLTKENDRLQVSMKLLKVRHRLAQLKVLDQTQIPSLNPTVPATGTEADASRPNLLTKIEFVEVNDNGEAIGKAKQFDIKGDMVYVDYLRVSFDDKYIEQSDLDRSTSIALFQRIFGEHQEAAQGFQLDTIGTRPTAYGRGTEMSDFEKKIWNDFWLIANEPKKATDMGIHAAHGSAVSMRVQKGKTYEIELRSTGDMTIRPIETKAPPATAEAQKGN